MLRFLQLEQWEVPFIWTNRRDYLHPLMTREHLWTLHHLEVGWDSVVASKMRLSDEVGDVLLLIFFPHHGGPYLSLPYLLNTHSFTGDSHPRCVAGGRRRQLSTRRCE